ncbi:glycosyltransferase family 2 protein [Salinivibrio sp. AR640]|uniref:glycosyltransferase family 2 protein n=1 Tax=Salinivibrio sp. AR640 TaxID=1909437 RepID=UPI000985B31D|nr:glycosyltransferase family 2 protein [Salinivibrio sp. AR640]OOE86292.1 glycosyl transferase family 2 [Salinivibrio sp. AR640]
MLVSIITPTYNAIDYIESVYNSICNQNYERWEWLVTDDCSIDGTYEFLVELSQKDPRVNVFKNKVNSGAALSRNNSISKSNGDFIAFIDSDDLWFSCKLTEQVNFMSSNAIDFCFTAYELIDENNENLGKTVDTHLSSRIDYQDLLRKKATVGCSTVMIRKSAFSDLEMPHIRTGQDYGLWLKLLKTGKYAYPLPSVLTQYRILPGSLSRNKIKKARRQWEIYRHLEKLDLLTSIECFCFYAFRAVFRK